MWLFRLHRNSLSVNRIRGQDVAYRSNIRAIYMKPMCHLVVVVLSLFAVGCSREGPDINFVIADDFVGHEFEVIVNAKLGPELKKQANGYTINVSSDGKAYIPTVEPFECWHRQRYSYQDGMRVSTLDITQTVGPGGLARAKQDGVIHEVPDGSRWIFGIDKSVVDQRLARKAVLTDDSD